jgi:Ca-activated chloride channel family protein
VKTAAEGTQYDAMWNYEATLKETNDKLSAAGKELLYAVYPADGVALADSPLGFVDRGKGADYEQFFSNLLAYLQTEPVEKQIADTGRRIPLAPAITAKPEPDWNFDPTRLVTAIHLPEPAVIRQALDLYQGALRKPSLTALCLDYSGSMEGDGETQLEKAMGFILTPAQAASVLAQWTPDDRILVFPFDSDVRTEFTATGSEADQAQLLSQVEQQSASGGTDMYACADQALAAIKATPNLGNYLPAIVIMTDGRTDGSSDQFLNDWRDLTPRVPVFGITFGDADATQLTALADATSARVFNGKADLAGAFRAARGYN